MHSGGTLLFTLIFTSITLVNISIPLHGIYLHSLRTFFLQTYILTHTTKGYLAVRDFFLLVSVFRSSHKHVPIKHEINTDQQPTLHVNLKVTN